MLLMIGVVTAATAPLSMVSGTVKDVTGTIKVNAPTIVICQHGNISNSQMVYTDTSGKYYAFFGSTLCSAGDKVYVVARSAKLMGQASGINKYNIGCRINTISLNVIVK
jgi:hypothetical protein